MMFCYGSPRKLIEQIVPYCVRDPPLVKMERGL